MLAQKSINGENYDVSVLDDLKWRTVAANIRSEGRAIRIMEKCKELASWRDCVHEAPKVK